MDISGLGLAILEQREGVRLEAYRDSRGIWTIGVGHTAMAGKPYPVPGMTITQQQASDIFHSDLQPGIAAINNAGLKLTQCQFDALCSLGFNIGWGSLTHSTVMRELAAGNVQAAADAFLMWDHPPELLGRRKEEREQFLTADADVFGKEG